MSTQKNTVNLTWPFIIWSCAFVGLGLLTHTPALFFVAAVPWVFFFGIMLLVCLTMIVMYLRGYPVTVTTPRKGRRTVRRG